MKFKDLAGQRFGKLVAVRRMAVNKHRNVMWECLCDCGGTITVAGCSLKSGNTQSCGCLSIGRRNKSTEKGKRMSHLKAEPITDHKEFKSKVIDSYKLPEIIRLRSQRHLVDIVPAINNRLAWHRGIMATWTRHFTALNVPWAITQAGKVQTLWKERRV